MANLLVLGVGPLPLEHSDRLHAPGIRTWQITRALAREHHFVTLCIIDFGDFQAQQKSSAPATAHRQDAGTNISLVKLSYHPAHTVQSLRTLHMATRFSAVISTTDIMNGIAADLNLDAPLWLDYNGDPFAEKQLQALVYQHDGSLLPQWELYLKGLAHGDHFSVCSNPQRHALIGQLAFAGRLAGANSGEDLVTVIPNSSRVMSERTPRRTTALKGKQIPATAFLVLWTGGYNTWSDPETLFHGLARAMEQNPSIHFATTGGAIEGHDDKSFQTFHKLVEQSPLRDRFVFLGWIPTEEVGSYYEQADLAIFTDRYSVEGELGTRTRLIDWIQFNVPILCTNLCETTSQLAEHNLIKTFPIGNAAALAEALLDAVTNQEELSAMTAKAREWLDTELSEKKALQPLLAWARAPRYARDKSPNSPNQPTAALTRLLLDQFTPGAPSVPAASAIPQDAPPPKPTFAQRLKKIFR